MISRWSEYPTLYQGSRRQPTALLHPQYVVPGAAAEGGTEGECRGVVLGYRSANSIQIKGYRVANKNRALQAGAMAQGLRALVTLP